MFTDIAPLIDVRGLGKTYGRRTVVAGVALRLAPGTLVGLVGANGGGKTTTLRMLAGLTRPSAGEGKVLGEDIGRARRPSPMIGYMAQSLGLYPELTARENLRFRADVHGLSNPRDKVTAAAAQFGIATVLDARFETLSGGWARRVQFAAATIHAPRLLLLDEPTAGLDVATRHALWAWLGAYVSQGGAAVIATHDLVEAERCPVVIYYADGRAAPAEPLTALLARAGAPTLEAAVLTLAMDA